MGEKIDTRAVGLDTGLALIRWITGAESLHYGDWTGLAVCAGNLRAAQDAYTDRILALLPPAPARILDIGGGAGETAKRLLAMGHSVEIVVPSAYLAARCRVNAPGARVHESRFEDFAGGAGFDVCLFSESFQYIPLAEGLPRALRILAPGGRVVIADCFRSDAYRGRDRHGPQPGGGHRLSTFRRTLEDAGARVTHEAEITAEVAPSIDLEQAFFNVLGLGLTRVREEMAAKRPLALWGLSRLLRVGMGARTCARLGDRLTGCGRTSEAFRLYNHYMIFGIAPEVLPQG